MLPSLTCSLNEFGLAAFGYRMSNQAFPTVIRDQEISF